MRGLGDSVSALIYLLVSTVINIVLDLLFVAKLGMGVNGVALATVIAQAVSALLCLLRLMKLKELFDLKFSYMKLQKKYTKKIIRFSVHVRSWSKHAIRLRRPTISKPISSRI